MHEKLLILAALGGLGLHNFRPGLLFGEGDDGGGGGGGGGEKGGEKGGGGGGEKTFSQAEVNALLARERKQIEAKAAEGAKALETKLAELSSKMKEAEDAKALEGKGPKEAEIIKAQQTIARLEGELKSATEKTSGLEKSLADALANHRTYRAREVLSRALSEKGAVKNAKALEQATALMLSETSAEITETDGKIAIAFSIDGKRYEDPLVAADTWLRANDHFLASAPGGSGSRAPNGAGPRRGGPLHELSESELAELAARDIR